ncbi:MAG TPA: nucleotide exchange factor GrpE [Lachnospiraceae bacterium]|nr:nucleotide exchange factor GrpE [Lachnospiraceae bacterium]
MDEEVIKEEVNKEEAQESSEAYEAGEEVNEEQEEVKEDEGGKDAGEDEVMDAGAEEETKKESKEDKDAGGREKKKIFKKKKDKKDEQIEALTDQVKRQMAEFDNFRKRTEKEKSSMYEMGARSVVEKILPVIDNFERGLDTVPEDEKESPFTEGMRMIYKQLMTELENIGVKPIEALGTEFNPDFHNAVMQVESEEYESGYVAQELQKGYMYRDSVVRHSMVAVVS